jgi:hypothetical protein
LKFSGAFWLLVLFFIPLLNIIAFIPFALIPKVNENVKQIARASILINTILTIGVIGLGYITLL